MSRFVIVGAADDQRITRFQAALARLQLPAATIIDYPDLIAGDIVLGDVLQAGDMLRIESPGKSVATEQLLLQLGAPHVEPQFERSAPIQHPTGFIYSSSRHTMQNQARE